MMGSDKLENYSVPGAGNFTFSAVSPDDLEELGYTVATVVLDASGSLEYKKDLLVEMLRVIANGLKKSSRKETILLRVITFNETISELHGFKPVSQIDPIKEYIGIDPEGMTALVDAMFSAVASTYEYAKKMHDDGYDANACVYVITDGMDNKSKKFPKDVSDQIAKMKAGEEVESIITALFGVNDPTSGWSQDVADALSRLQAHVDFTEYIDAGDVDEKNVGKIGGVVSSSITSTSQALGKGGPSQQLPSKAF